MRRSSRAWLSSRSAKSSRSCVSDNSCWSPSTRCSSVSSRAETSAGRRDASDYFRVLAPGLKEDIEQYRRAAPRSHVAEIHDASHWVFLSNHDKTLNAVRTFLVTLGP